MRFLKHTSMCMVVTFHGNLKTPKTLTKTEHLHAHEIVNETNDHLMQPAPIVIPAIYTWPKKNGVNQYMCRERIHERYLPKATNVVYTGNTIAAAQLRIIV